MPILKYMTKTTIFIIDSSAILSGKPINIPDAEMITAPGIANEFSPGGRDYRTFELLKEKGLKIQDPTTESIEIVSNAANKTGDIKRLSPPDIEILALAIDIISENEKQVIILTDDYTIQNIANYLNIDYKSFQQKGITKNFKWIYSCQGCKRKYKDSIKECPICGTETKQVILRAKDLKKK